MTRPGANAIYQGHVMHMRLQPRAHRFRHAVFSLMLDVDRLPQTARGLRLMRHNGFGVLSVHDADHGARDGSPLRPWIDDQLTRNGRPVAARVAMLSFPRVLGVAFNPLTVYYCYDDADHLSSVIYEVKNTFGEQIAYTLPVGDEAGGAYRQTQRKRMYVSPFIGMDQTYRFSLNDPGDRLALRIRQAGPEGETLIATHTGQARQLTDAGLARALLRHPLMGVRVIALIHWHALLLALKGVRYHAYADSRQPNLRKPKKKIA